MNGFRRHTDWEDLNQKEQVKSRIDFHMHTTNSDGENTPEEVIQLAKDAGLAVIAITDHNKFTYTECIHAGDLDVIPGIEFSAEYKVPAWNDDTAEVHIVGIFPDGVNGEAFDDIFININEGKEAYVRAILDDLKSRDIDISMDEVRKAQGKCDHIGRHQIAQVLINKGYAGNTDEAFDKYIGNFSPYYIPSTRYIHYASMKVIVKRIREEGGIPILAHPYGYLMNADEMEKLIADFKQAAGNIAGMEVYYEQYIGDLSRMEFLKLMQNKYGLLASAGSDRHGPGQTFASCGDISLYEKMVIALNNH